MRGTGADDRGRAGRVEGARGRRRVGGGRLFRAPRARFRAPHAGASADGMLIAHPDPTRPGANAAD
jgi:hypothetical protein